MCSAVIDAVNTAGLFRATNWMLMLQPDILSIKCSRCIVGQRVQPAYSMHLPPRQHCQRTPWPRLGPVPHATLKNGRYKSACDAARRAPAPASTGRTGRCSAPRANGGWEPRAAAARPLRALVAAAAAPPPPTTAAQRKITRQNQPQKSALPAGRTNGCPAPVTDCEAGCGQCWAWAGSGTKQRHLRSHFLAVFEF